MSFVSNSAFVKAYDCCDSTQLPYNTWGYGYIYGSPTTHYWYMSTEKRWVSLSNRYAERDFYVNVWDTCSGCSNTGQVSNFITTCWFNFGEPYSKCSFPATAGATYLTVSGNSNQYNPYYIKYEYACGSNQCYSEYWDGCYYNGDLCCDGDIVPDQWYCQYSDNTWNGCTDSNHNVCGQTDTGKYTCQEGYYDGDWRWRDCSSCYGDCKYPDLTIPEAWLDPPPANIDPDEYTTIYFKIKNLNDVDSKYSYTSVAYYLNGVFQKEDHIGELEAFEEFTWWFKDKLNCGYNVIEILADSEKSIMESNEYNNGNALSFTVDCKDLTVTDIHINPDPPYAEQSTDVGFSIKNVGNKKITENFYNKIYINGIGKKTIYETSDIEPQHGINYHNPLTVNLDCGFHTISAVTDTSNNVKEINENNNMESEQYYWSCPSGKTCINGECCECTSGACCDGCHYYQPSDNHQCSSADSCSDDDLCTHYECDGTAADTSACTIKSGCSDCGTKDCDVNNNYYLSGTNSATQTSYCKYRDYADCNKPCYSNSCQDCNCNSYSDSTQATAGICRYIGGCSGSTHGTVKNYAEGTFCGVGEECDGNGNCITKQKKINTSLNQGWNLISIPLILDDNSVSSVFTGLSYSQIFYYDSEWKEPTEINNTKGYWLKMNSAATLTVEGLPPESTPPSLNSGWNLIGYPYLEEKNIPELYTNEIVYAYNNSQWYSYNPDKPSNTLAKFTPGYGYWVKAE